MVLIPAKNADYCIALCFDSPDERFIEVREERGKMNGAWIDRPREAGDAEGDEAFLERVDLLVTAEWSGRRREENLQRLRENYAVRAELLSVLQDLLAVRRATGCIAALPSRSELQMLLHAIRREQLGGGEEELSEPDVAVEAWELPEEHEESPEWNLDRLILPSSAVTPA